MVPARFQILEALPLTPNGKIDRKVLQKAPLTAAVEWQHRSEPALFGQPGPVQHVPYRIHYADHRLCAIAGIWSDRQGDARPCCSMLTCRANKPWAQIHNAKPDDPRMICFLTTPQAIRDWLDPANTFDRLRQLLLNLIGNAIKFTGDGGTITLSATRQGNMARISVSDTGIGIAPENLSRIFDRFYQADDSRVHRSESDGAGLGLSIAYWIVETHKGKIDVESTIGEGTTFVVTIPLLKQMPPTPHHIYHGQAVESK